VLFFLYAFHNLIFIVITAKRYVSVFFLRQNGFYILSIVLFVAGMFQLQMLPRVVPKESTS